MTIEKMKGITQGVLDTMHKISIKSTRDAHYYAGQKAALEWVLKTLNSD